MILKKHALLIGVNQYPLLDDLAYAEPDALAVADSLREHYGFQENEITLMTSGATGAKQAVQRYLEKQLQLLRKSHHGLDLFFIGFWGHGFLQ